MESITESHINKCDLTKSKILLLKNQLSPSNQKIKYKKKYLHLDSIQTNNDICEMTKISRINSINTNVIPFSSSPNKRPKWRVSFAPRYKFITYINYDPKDIVLKEKSKKENKGIIKEEKEEKEEKESKKKN